MKALYNYKHLLTLRIGFRKVGVRLMLAFSGSEFSIRGFCMNLEGFADWSRVRGGIFLCSF